MIKLKESCLGFTDNKTPIQKARIENTLNKLIRSEGIVYQNKEFILTRLQEGYSPVMEENYSHYSSKLQDYTKPKTDYRLERKDNDTTSLYHIEKTLYNYALYLQENDLLNAEKINNFITIEAARIETERKAIENQELKERQEKELQEKKGQEFKTWLENEAMNYSDIEKMELSKEIFLDTIGSYRQNSINELLVCIDNIDNSMCREEVKNRLWNGNKASKKVFFYVTGVRLPATDKETKQLLNTIQKENYTGMLLYKKRETHEKHIRTFYKHMRVPEPHFEECRGEYIKKYELDLFITKENGNWYVTEGKTGCLFAEGTTKEEVLQKIKNIKDNNKIEGLKIQINRLTEQYGISPLYQDKEEAI